MITINPSKNIPCATGIPTHIELSTKMDTLINNNKVFLNEIKQQSSIIQQAVKDAIQENDILSGTVTMPILVKHLDDRYNTLIEFIKKMVCCHVLENKKRLQIWLIAVLMIWPQILLLLFQHLICQYIVTMVDSGMFQMVGCFRKFPHVVLVGCFG